MDQIRKKSFDVWDMCFQKRTVIYETSYDKRIAKYRVVFRDGLQETQFVYTGDNDICQLEEDAKQTFMDDNHLIPVEMNEEEY